MLKCLRGAALTVALLTSAAEGQAGKPLREFRIDAGHSTVEFSIPFLGHAVRGRFDDVKGLIVLAPDPSGDPRNSAVSVVIAAASISTGSSHRDEHLRSDDFFDVAKYAAIVFRSERVERAEGGYVLAGKLAMHGVERTVRIPFTASPVVDDPHGSTLVHYNGALRIARKDFGILGGSKHNDWFDELRSATMGDSVDITLDVAGWRTDFARSRQLDAPLQRLEKDGVDSTAARIRAALTQQPRQFPQMQWELEQAANALIDRNRATEACALLEGVLSFAPPSADLQAALARAWEERGNREKSRAAARAALALQPLHPRALEVMRRVSP